MANSIRELQDNLVAMTRSMKALGKKIDKLDAAQRDRALFLEYTDAMTEEINNLMAQASEDQARSQKVAGAAIEMLHDVLRKLV